MSTWKTLVSLAVVAAGAAAAAVLAKKNPAAESSEPTETEKVPVSPAAPVNAETGTYSFVAGYSAALNSEVSFSYDADKLSFDISEDFSLNDTNVSHVALLHSDRLDVQLEYAEFYPGEGMEELKKSCAERHNDCEELTFGENTFLKYTDGDCICLVKDVEGNAECYAVFSIFKAKDNDDKLPALLGYPEVSALLTSVETKTL